MKISRFLVTAIVCIILGICFRFIATPIFMAHKKQIMAHKKMYCYETYHKGYVNPALYVRDTDLCDSLKQYYQKIEKGNSKASFNFQPREVPLDTCVYVLGYSKDSSIAKISFFYQYNNRNFSDDGYVYANTLHEKRRYNRLPTTNE